MTTTKGVIPSERSESRDLHRPTKIKFSNLKKIYWPAEQYTKGDLIDYYRGVSKWIVSGSDLAVVVQIRDYLHRAEVDYLTYLSVGFGGDIEGRHDIDGKRRGGIGWNRHFELLDDGWDGFPILSRRLAVAAC